MTRWPCHENLPTPLDETYRNHWRTRLSDQDPPDTEIVIVGTKSKHELPIHDRWWLTKGAGLRMGTSFHSLGVGRDSELSSLTSEDTLAFEREVDRYLTRSQRDHQGERMLYTRVYPLTEGLREVRAGFREAVADSLDLVTERMRGNSGVRGGEFRCQRGKSGVLQPIMPLDLPVKVRPWELTVYPRSHIRR